MQKGFKILTITHRQTKLKDLSHFVIKNADEADLKNKLEKLKSQCRLEELLYLSTCNRVMYFIYDPKPLTEDFIKTFFSNVNPDLPTSISDNILDHIAVYDNTTAIEHLYEVASSIDSLVVGEREIFRQLREAYKQSKNLGLTGDHIRLAMKSTVVAAKEVYAKTRIGEKPISVVSLAIQKLLETQLPKDARLLLVGAGQTNTLVAKFLKKHAFTNITVFNRNIERAQQLATVLGGKSFSLSELSNYREGFDGIIVCTGATEAIITSSLYKQLLVDEEDKKVLIDLAIPNNIGKEVISNFNVHYIEIDGLRNLAKENHGFRSREVVKAKALLKEQLVTFQKLFKQRQIEKAMRKVPAEIKAIKSHAINEVFKKELDILDDDSRELLERMMAYMEKRCISIPMEAAKNAVL